MIQVIVTGASGGIGRAIALGLAERGARVALHYHSNERAAEETRGAMAGSGHKLFRADLSDSTAIETLWREIGSSFGKIDALVNNAGIFPDHPPLKTAYAAWKDAWQRTLAVNLVGPAHLCFFAAQAMAKEGSGRIVNISSRAAFRGELTAPAYAAAKSGLNAFSQSMAKVLAPKGVYVFVVAPGWVSTERVAQYVSNPSVVADQPLGRVAAPDEVAKVVAFCVMDAPASLTGAVLDVNGASYLR
jgi:NAD(P)-dependent dehydrogenase (short-subunit alcohol dehydrogenase family)